MSESRSYEVGYGRPPKHARFQKGQSGNPQGRPKGCLNIVTALERELNQRVVIKENGQPRTITKFEAAIKQLVNKAASGDAKAIQLLVTILNVSNGGALKEVALTIPNDADQAVMKGILRRLQSVSTHSSEEKVP